MIIGIFMIILAILAAYLIISRIEKDERPFFVICLFLCISFTFMGTWKLMDILYPHRIEYIRGNVNVNFECELIDSTCVIKDAIIKYKK